MIQLGDIGDVVLSFPCVRALREHYPQAKIIVAVREKAAELIELCPDADGAVPVVGKARGILRGIASQAKFVRQLRVHRFDLAIDLRTGTRGAILAFLSGARERVGFVSDEGRPWRNWVFDKIYRPSPQPGLHMTRYLLNILGAYGIATEKIHPEFVVPDALRERADDILRKHHVSLDKPLVGLQPFSLWGYKELAEKKYVQLIRWIVKKYQLPILVFGGLGEQERAQAIVDRCGCEGVYNLAGKTTIGVYGALLRRCGLFVGVDSAGQHLAAAAGVATVIVYGPSCPSTWAPMGERHCVVQKDLDCVPCHQAGCDGDCLKSRCLDELAVDEVFSAVERQLDSLIASGDCERMSHRAR